MVFQARVTYPGDGLTISTQGMILPLKVVGMHSENIANFGIPGYQAKTPIITSFAETLGAKAVDQATSTEIGRLRLSGNSLDFALNSQGYFQKLNRNGGVELSRDGRMTIDKDGYLRALDGKQILSRAGVPLQFQVRPNEINGGKLKVSPDGTVQVYDPKTGKDYSPGAISVVLQDGTPASEVDVKQGYVEDSNVYLAKEYAGMIPYRRQFEANRQLFILQNDGLSRMIQELGRTQ